MSILDLFKTMEGGIGFRGLNGPGVDQEERNSEDAVKTWRGLNGAGADQEKRNAEDAVKTFDTSIGFRGLNGPGVDQEKRNAKESKTKESKTKEAAKMLKDKAIGNTAQSGFGTGMAVGQGLGTPGGSSGPTASAASKLVGDTLNTVAGKKKQQDTGKAMCNDCNSSDCEHISKIISILEHGDTRGVGKALNTRSLSVPFYLRNPNYEPNDVYRSATQQTSRMYTSISPDVQNTFNTLLAQDKDPRARAVKAAEDTSRAIKALREHLLVLANTPRKDPNFG